MWLTTWRVALVYLLNLLGLIKWRLVSILKIEKCWHTDAKNSKLGGKNKEQFILVGGDEEKELELGVVVLVGGSKKDTPGKKLVHY